MSNDVSGSPWTRLVQRIAPRLRYPHLFLIMLGLFVLDLFVPDPVPLVDEVLLGLLTFLVGSLRTRRQEPEGTWEAGDDSGSGWRPEP
jgi:hypothetical protein